MLKSLGTKIISNITLFVDGFKEGWDKGVAEAKYQRSLKNDINA